MIELQKICKTYQGKRVAVEALKEVSFTLPDRGMVFLLGKSGSGKSTLLNLLGGLDSFDKGELFVDGKSVREFTPEEADGYRNGYVGFVFQEYNFVESFTVEENLSLAVRLQGRTPKKEEIASVLARLGLEGLEKRKPSSLSGGQRQRVTIARALLKEAKILLADEPTGALDSETGKQIFEVLKDFSKENLVVVVSHDREFARKYADRIIELRDGRVVSDNGKEEVSGERTFALKKAKLPLFEAVKIGFSSCRLKPVRTVFSVLLSAFAFLLFCFSGSLLFYNPRSTVLDIVREDGKEREILSFCGVETMHDDPSYYNHRIRLGERELTGFSEIGTCRGVMTLYGNDPMNVRPTSSARAEEAFPRYTDTMNGCLDLQGFVDLRGTSAFVVAGRAPETADEIALSTYWFKLFFANGYEVLSEAGYSSETVQIDDYADLIGRELWFYAMKSGELVRIPLTVTGIFSSNDFYGTFCKAHPEEEKSELDSLLRSRYRSSYESFAWVSDAFREVHASTSESNGSSFLPQGEGVYSFLVCPSEGAEKLLGKVVFPSTREQGATGSGGDFGIMLYVPSCDEIEGVFSLMRSIDLQFGLFFGASVAFALFASLLLASLISASMDRRAKDLAILRALGARRTDIFTIFLVEGLFVAGVSALIAIGAMAILSALANGYVKATLSGLGIFYLYPQSVLLTLLIAFLVAVLSTHFPVKKKTKRSPALLLRAE